MFLKVLCNRLLVFMQNCCMRKPHVRHLSLLKTKITVLKKDYDYDVIMIIMADIINKHISITMVITN